ncbi:MAG: rod shape-determining protein MreC [Syntrophomonadaceae bacterium]|nr:rod shape-determining protein MreC [Syntrophomonadaceae bacterium]
MFDFLKGKYFWIILVMIIVSVMIIPMTSTDRQDNTAFEKMVQGLYAPLQRGVNFLAEYLDDLGSYFVNKQDLVAIIQNIEKERQLYLLENQALKEYQYEAQRLKELLDFKDQNLANMDLIPAQVIARSPNNWYSTININRGYSHGVAKDMAVITPLGLVGRVSFVGKDSAQVMLITDREGAVGALIQETRVPGIVVGDAKSKQLYMNHLQFYSEIKSGDQVVTSRFSEYFPQGIIIGKIGEVTSDPEILSKTATVIPAVDLDQFEEVLVIRGYTNPAPQWNLEQPIDEEPQP